MHNIEGNRAGFLPKKRDRNKWAGIWQFGEKEAVRIGGGTSLLGRRQHRDKPLYSSMLHNAKREHCIVHHAQLITQGYYSRAAQSYDQIQHGTPLPERHHSSYDTFNEQPLDTPGEV